MDKARVHKIADEALRELEFQTWSVSTVWRRKKIEGETSLKTTNPTADWIVDFNNDEGTFPRVFFHYKEEDGEVWVKREVKRQLADLRERALLQNWLSTTDKTNSSIPSANSNTFVEPPPPEPQQQRRDPSRPSAKATKENYAKAGDAVPYVEPDINATQSPPALPAKGNSSPTLEKTTLPLRRPRSGYQPTVRKSALVTAVVVVVVSGSILLSQLKNSRTAASTPVDQKTEREVDPNPLIEPSPTTTLEKAKIVVPDWPSLAAASSSLPLQPADGAQGAAADTRVAKGKWTTAPKTEPRLRRFASLPPAPAGEPSLTDNAPVASSRVRKNAGHADLNQAIHDWATAYGNQDVRREISFYAGNVMEYKSNRNIPREDIAFDKERSVDRSKDVKTTVGEPIISSDPAGYTARVTVSKSVTSKNGEKTEEGTKEIRWQKTRSGWKIVGEKDLILAQ